MGKYITIQIPKSCQQDWDAMLPNTQGKHCNACQKTVVDFTAMTDAQLAQFFKKKTNNVCGRFYDDQLEKQIALPKRELPWLKYFFTITLPAFLFSQKSWGQKSSIRENTVLVEKQIKAEEILCYASKIAKVKKDSIVDLEEVFVKSNVTQGRLRISMGDVAYSKSVQLTNPIKEKSILENKSSGVSIFPNPISSNSKLNIVWDKPISTNQYIEIFDSKGSLVQKEIVIISAKTKTAFVNIKKIIAGMYFIKITDANTKIKLSNGFIVN